jgi:hypothetical protein
LLVHSRPAAFSTALLFLTSDTGKKVAANFPPLAGYLAGMGLNIPHADVTESPALVSQARLSAFQNGIPCNAPAGALFNLEPQTGSPELPFPAPQLANSLDQLPQGGVVGSDLVIATGDDYRGVFDQILNGGGAGLKQFPDAWGFTMSGYYVHRSGTDCSPSFEGALPHIDFRATHDVLFGYGPSVAIDSNRRQAYAVDVRFAASVNGLGLFRTTIATLNDASRCANGTHLTGSNGDDTEARSCWPTAILLNPQLNNFPSTFSDSPHVAVDERADGVGSGVVYVTWTNFDSFHGTFYIQLIACPANFRSAKDCSAPITISGSDPLTQSSHIAIRPDGIVSITYVNINLIETDTPPYERQTFDLKHVSCTPSAAGTAPTCSQPSLIVSELQPIPFAAGPGASPTSFPPATFPVHDYRVNGNNMEEFVAWARCKVDPYFWVGSLPFQNCVDADVLFTWSVTDANGAPLEWALPVLADGARGHQIMPALKTDRSRNTIEMVYLSTSADAYNERYLAVRREFPPGMYSPDSPRRLISVPIEPNADAFLRLFIGNSLGLSARQGSGYLSFTGEAYEGLVRKTLIPGNNDLVHRF